MMVVNQEKLILHVHTAVDDEPIQVTIDERTTAEDVCVKIAKDLRIGPVARHLFALRVFDKNIYLSQNFLLTQLRSASCLFRLRFKVPDPERLETVDASAYNYFFHQARREFVKSEVPDISYEKKEYKKEAVGLAITDMYRFMLENGVEKSAVVQDYKKFFPKDVQSRHSFFLKKPIAKYLNEIEKTNHGTMYVKRLWIEQFGDMAPAYLTEEYTALSEDSRALTLHVDPFHKDIPGVQVRSDGRKEWSHLCAIDELCSMTARFNDNTVEISRKNGIPSCLKFPNIPIMLSFVSLLDGYYRLMVRWTFNLCKEVPTPSLKKVHGCHGPVGKEFSYSKLKKKRENSPGCFILRECDTQYDTYYLDVCYLDSTKEKPKPKVKSYKVETEIHVDDEGGKKTVYVLALDKSTYSSMQELIHSHKAEGSNIWLKECVPPSDYDESWLMLCKLNHSTEIENSQPPQIIDPSKIQMNEGSIKGKMNSLCTVNRGIWKAGRNREIEVAVKKLKPEHCDKQLQMDLLAVGSQWSLLQSPSIVRVLGMTLVSPVSMVMEYIPLGRLDVYLQENRRTIKTVDLVEASAKLATALWHLEENGFVHGNIRCRKLLVATHNETSFSVRLADPGLHSFTPHDVHWVPPECYNNLVSATTEASADVWAFGTTMWEIFAYGDPIPQTSNVDALKNHYLMGLKLPCPPSCTKEIFQLILECWEVDPLRRKKPQAIMRDINQIFYQVYNSRRTHTYSVAFPKQFREQADDTCSISDSEISMLSGATVETLLDSASERPLISLGGGAHNLSHSGRSSLFADWMLGDSREQLLGSFESMSPDISALLSNINFSTTRTSMESMESIFELGPDVNVVLQGCIGQGFYGEVYKGTLERMEGDAELVAVKKLRTDALSTTLHDFEREINIMKTLEHPNIVQIKGVVHEPEILLVMEFVQHGSLKSYLQIHRDRLLPEKHLLKFALDVAKGMDYLGQKNIVHRDLAARNILVVDENNVKISDFGLAQVMGQNEYYIIRSNRELPIPWYAPESLRDGKFSARSDVWSYGVTLYEMFSHGQEPHLASCKNDQDHHELLSVLERGDRLPCPADCPQEIYVDLMASCWKSESRDRPSFSDVCKLIVGFMSSYVDGC